MQLTVLIELLSKFGGSVVILGIFIFLFLQWEKRMRADYEKMFEKVISNNNVHILSSDENEISTLIDVETNKLLYELLRETRCDRAYIIRYHNGGKDMLGNSFLKMSISNEVVSQNVKPIMSEFQNQYRSLIAYPCREMDDNGLFYVKDIENIKDKDMTFYSFLKSREINSMYCRALYSGENTVIGFITVCYITEHYENKDVVLDTLIDYASRINTILKMRNP